MDLDILRLKERIEIATEVGESHYREFKSAFEGPFGAKRPRELKEICYDIARTLVAFANADGGELYVGIEDDSTVTGIDFSEREISYLLSAPTNYVHKDTPLPSLKKSIIDYNGKKVIFFSVIKGTDRVCITADGKCVQRKDLESVPISPEAIIVSRQEIISRDYDRQAVDAASLNDLAIPLIEECSKNLSRNISVEKFLQYLELAEFDGGSIRLKRAALLLFSKNLTRWHPRSQVRVIRVKGTQLLTGKDYNVVKDETVSDNIVNLIVHGWELLRPYLVETKLTQDAIFISQISYPELACREALINAIAHRDYSNEGRGIEIYIYDDRIEFINPGELLSSIKLEDIKKLSGVHQSRNTNISKTLKEIGYMRELGEGFRRIYKLLNENELATPEVESSNGMFKVTMYQKTIYSKDEILWLDNFDKITLTRDEKNVVKMGYKGELISPQSIWDIIGIVDTDYYRQILESLRKKGILVSKVSKLEAQNIAKSKKIDKKSVRRFLIRVPRTDVEKNIKIASCDENNNMILDSAIELDSSDYAKIFVSNIPYDTNKHEITKLLSQYGKVVSVEIPINHETQQPRGFVFVEFENSESVDKVYNDRFNLRLGERKIYIQKYKPRS